MENTNLNPFGTNEADFFLARGDDYVGPLRPSEIHAKLQAKEIDWIDHCYRELEGKWMRICDHPVFKALQPEPPKPKPKVMAPPPPPKAKTPKVRWFLFQDETQSGPYSEEELRRLVQVGQIKPRAFLWQESFSDWKPISEVPEFRVGEMIKPEVKEEDRRVSPRRPLVAQIYLTNQKQISSGMCRDISVGGMQVLTDEIPGKAGESIQLNVMPPASTGLRPFVAQGVIVRILEDQRGFSFRFTEINDEAKSSIERYVS